VTLKVAKTYPILNKDNQVVGYAFHGDQANYKVWKITNHGAQVKKELSGGCNPKDVDGILRKEYNQHLDLTKNEVKEETENED